MTSFKKTLTAAAAALTMAVAFAPAAEAKFHRNGWLAAGLIGGAVIGTTLAARGAVFVTSEQDVPEGATIILSATTATRADEVKATLKFRGSVTNNPGRQTIQGQLRGFGRYDPIDDTAAISGSAFLVMPEICGVIVGNTWSPHSITPASGSNKQR